MDNDNTGPDLTYAEALAAVARSRWRSITPELSVLALPFPSSHVDPVLQVKLATAIRLMESVGRLPGDFPQSQFDRPINYRVLSDRTIRWLEKCQIPARRGFAPLASIAYIWVFGDGGRLPVPQVSAGRFWGRLIHLLTVETRIIIAKQYYHGLGFYQPGIPLSVLNEILPEGMAEAARLTALPGIDLGQLHGLMFLDYTVIMIRAQWDKLMRLACMVFGVSHNWASISDGISALEQNLTETGLNPWCRDHAQFLLRIAEDRLSEKGWLRPFRDSLLHDVGEHPEGVVPHRGSLETTSELWDKVCDEHDWIREAMMAALVSFITRNSATPSTT